MKSFLSFNFPIPGIRRQFAKPGDASGSDPERLSRLEGKKRPIIIAATVFLALVVGALGGLEAWSRLNARESQLEESRVATVNIAQATAEHAEKTIDLVSAILYGIVERVESDGVGEAAFPRLHNLMMARVEQTPALQGLFVYDETGRWAVTSLPKVDPGANNADRAYFIYHRTHLERGLRIGAPIQSRSSGAWVLPVSRRLEHRDGSFAGVALATVRIQYFQQYYDSFDVGQHGAIFMALDDGTLITRRPLQQGQIGASIRNGPVFAMLRANPSGGTAMGISKLDHIERLYTYRQLDAYPIVIAAGLSKRDIFSPWWDDTWRESSVMVVLLAILVLVGYRLLRQVLIRDRLEQELRGSRAALEESNKELARLANVDALTGLKNRRYLSEHIDSEMARAVRERSSLAVIMLDIDFFKRYNDTYGHVGGDKCLALVSAAIGGATRRPTDLAARYGGEEFAVLLPNTDARGAQIVAEAICRAVNMLGVPHIGSPLGVVTISAGVFAGVPASAEDGRLFLEAADGGLYKAKAAGRNQVATGTRAPAPVRLTIVPSKVNGG